jgi:hypothetical protein
MFLDELQAISSDDIYLALASALHKNPDAKLVVTSAAAAGADTPLGRLRSRALAGRVSRRGPFVDARTNGLRWLSWELQEDADIANMRQVKACNPASWITAAQLRERRERLPERRQSKTVHGNAQRNGPGSGRGRAHGDLRGLSHRADGSRPRSPR